MDLRQLGYFVAVAEEGQFTPAAQRVLVAHQRLAPRSGAQSVSSGKRCFIANRARRG
jgi:hypothetical protein